MQMILVTGSTGFLGRFIVRELLAKGKSVRALARNVNHSALKEFKGRIEVVEGDLLEVGSLHDAFRGGVSEVIHTAAVVSFWNRQKETMRRVNQQGTANIVNFCLEYQVRKIVHVSSIAALGTDATPITEECRFKPELAKSYYGYTKSLAEKQIQRGVEEGLQAAICNPSVIVGAGDWRFGSPNLFQKVHRGLSICPKGANGFVAAEDVARAALLLLESPFNEGEKFILNAENLSYQQVFGLIARHLNRKPPAHLVSHAVAAAYGWLQERIADLTGKEPLVTQESALSASRTYVYDSSKFQRAFNYTFQPVETVIQQTAQQFLKEHGLAR